MIVVFAEGLATRPPLKRGDKLLRSELLRAGLNPARMRFRGPGEYMGDADYILAMGTPSLHGVTLAEDLTQDRGVIWPHPLTGALVMLTFHPNYVLRRQSAMSLFRSDVGTFAAMVLVDTGEGARIKV